MTKYVSMIVLAAITVFSAHSGWCGQEEQPVEKLIMDHARALSDFPKTRDVESVTRFYSEDYAGISDAQWESYTQLKKKFTDLRDEVNGGATLIIDYRASDVRVQVFGTTALATYDFNARLGKGPILRKNEHGKCTGIYRRKGSSWSTVHLHCSTP